MPRKFQNKKKYMNWLAYGHASGTFVKDDYGTQDKPMIGGFEYIPVRKRRKVRRY